MEMTLKLNETMQIDNISLKEIEQLKSQLESTNIKLQRYIKFNTQLTFGN